MEAPTVRLRKPAADFTMVPNALLRDARLSLKAKGIYALLFSKPDDWRYIEEVLIRESSDGRDGFRAGVRELVGHGWLYKRQAQSAGKFSHTEWVLTVDGKAVDGFAVAGKSDTTNTDVIKTDEPKEEAKASSSGTKAKPRAKTLTSLEQQFGNSPSLPAAYLDIATAKHGMSPDDALRLWADFSDHYIAKNARWAGERGWSLTWQKWCRNRPQRSGGGPRQPNPTAGQRNARALVADLAGWAEAIRDGSGDAAPVQPGTEPQFVGSGDAGADHGIR